MSPVTPAAIERAFEQEQLLPLPAAAYQRMATYLELLVRWNSRFNLTALRTPEEILQRHLVECAFAAQKLPAGISTLMDYGSGAGLPGLIIALCRPEINVTLAEAHGKKVAFLREVGRSLSLQVDIFAGRVEEMPGHQRFHLVTMRAVEKMEEAISIAVPHMERYLALMTTRPLVASYQERFPELEFLETCSLPHSEQAILALAVPRGTRV